MINRRVLVFGSFDFLHKGHHYLFESARKLGDELFVVVARDETIKKVKGHDPKFDENERVRHVKEVSFVDDAFLGSKGNKFDIIQKINPDVIALGYDQESFTGELDNELRRRKLDVKIVRLKAFKPEVFKSSKFKDK